MGVKSHKIWTDAEEVFLIEHHGKLGNRELAQRLGREVYSIEGRVARLRKAGLIPLAPLEPKWTEADDRELMACCQTLTSEMLAERFGRSKGSIDTRIRRLRERGWNIKAMPRGRVRTKQAEKAKAEFKEPDLSTTAEREAMRDEVMAYLKAQVAGKKIELDHAKAIAQTISQNVLQAPELRFKRYAQRPVAEIVQGAA